MDAITTAFLFRESGFNPGRAVRLSHQFLDGVNGKECGCVPDDWNGETVLILGQWWREMPERILVRR